MTCSEFLSSFFLIFACDMSCFLLAFYTLFGMRLTTDLGYFNAILDYYLHWCGTFEDQVLEPKRIVAAAGRLLDLDICVVLKGRGLLLFLGFTLLKF